MPTKLDLLACNSCKSGALQLREQALQCTNCGADVFRSSAACRASFPATTMRVRSASSGTSIPGRSWIALAACRSRATGCLQRPNGRPSFPAPTILEVGSGAGRFTEVLVTTGATVISCDLSSAVDANYRNNGTQREFADRPGEPAQPADSPRARSTRSFASACCSTRRIRRSHLRASPNASGPAANLSSTSMPRACVRCCPGNMCCDPITKRMNGERLYRLIERVTPVLFPISNALYRLFGQVWPAHAADRALSRA